ncbi:MAG: hypothetical protein WD381_05220 [Balneolaceae bacterium]
MAKNNSAEKEIKETIKKEKESIEKMYGDVISRLDSEKDKIQQELRHEFRNARRYVRENPETGVGAAFAGGLIVGIVVAKLFNR